jgi:mono/diheme cytochrome c family protein
MMRMGLIAAGLVLAVSAPAAAAPAAGAGAALYAANCAACHQAGGAGVPEAFPALKGSKMVLGDGAQLAAVMLHGKAEMPPFKDALNDAQLADLANYIRTAWGNAGSKIAPGVFARVRACPKAGCR